MSIIISTHIYKAIAKKKPKRYMLCFRDMEKHKDETFNKLPLVQIYVKLSISTGEP